jgi:hypothetical protein
MVCILSKNCPTARISIRIFFNLKATAMYCMSIGGYNFNMRKGHGSHHLALIYREF